MEWDSNGGKYGRLNSWGQNEIEKWKIKTGKY